MIVVILQYMEKNGLTQDFPKHSRCDRCDMALEFSMMDNVYVVYSRGSNTRNGFFCVRCATNPARRNKSRNPRVTLEQVEKFVLKCSSSRLKH